MYDLTRSDTILLHQMGKVASTAISRGLEQQGVSVVHCHRLNPRYLELSLIRPEVIPARRAVEILQQRRVLHALEDGKRTRLAKIVTPFREPIGWLVSRTFQAVFRTAGTAHTADVREIAAFCTHLRAIADAALRHRGTDSDSLMDEIAARLDKEGMPSPATELLQEVLRLRTATEWFEAETRRYAGIDVFATPFAPGASHQFYDNVLVIKYERFDQAAVEALQVYAQVPQLVIGRANANDEDGNSEAYAELRSTLRFPRIFLEHIYGVPYMRHFYSEAERREFIQRWDDSPGLAA